MNRYKTYIFFLIATFLSLKSFCISPSVRIEDKIRIKEAISIRDHLGENIWKGISKVPFALVLVTKEYEYLFYHPNPSSDFSFLEKDTITNTSIYYRKTQFPVSFEATFPAVNGISCIVIGTPENTQSKHSSRWLLTVLHENFHQYQASQPNHYLKVEALGLSNGDTSGMWQLNYPFPYKNGLVESCYKDYTEALFAAIQNRNTKQFETLYKQFLQKRQKFKNILSEKDYTYFSFQIWKEGIARYTEYKYLQALQTYEISEAFERLKDYKPFSQVKKELENNESSKLSDWKLPERKRIVFYSVGWAEGLLLDQVNPNWRQHYFSEPFQLEKIFRQNYHN